MHSNKYDYDYEPRRPQSSRVSRPRDKDDRRDYWKGPQRSTIRDAYETHIAQAERVSCGDYDERFTREFHSDSDWRNKRSSSRDGNASEKRRRAQDDNDQYKYIHELEDHSQRYKDLKQKVSVEDGYSRRRTPAEESRYNQPHVDFHYSDSRRDCQHRPATESYHDRDGRERSSSADRSHLQDHFRKSYSPLRQTRDGFSRDEEDENYNRSRFSLNGSSRLRDPSHRRLSPPPPPPPPLAAAGEKKMTKGFQRFLDVLNMGVNMETLTQIVTQSSPDVQPSFKPHMDHSWTEQSQRPNPQHWPQNEMRHQSETPSYISNGKAMRKESPSESHQFEFLSQTANAPCSDDKRKQVHDVLQAIGIKFEFEELGQMSSRIEERLYGKKQPEIALPRNIEDEERETRRLMHRPKRRSQSSSGSSSGGSGQKYKKSHVHHSQLDERDFSYSRRVITPDPQQRSNTQPIPPPVPPTPSPHLPYLPPSFPFVTPNTSMPPLPQFPSLYPPNLPISPPNIPPPNFPISHPNIPPPTGPVSAPAPQSWNRNPTKRHRCLQQIHIKK